MASLSLKHIYKVYDGGVKAVNDFCMEIEDKEFIVFVGPSGCGKSTTLRMIAGLEEITAGELRIGDEIVNDYEPKDRNIAMVFQNYALYPHMSVYENMAFALRTIHMPNDQIHEKVMEAAQILGITEYLERKPKALSGGQRQRVALGRAIVRNPKVFLLDEPLSNLDAKLRASMRTEISRLHERLQTTFIYVTHDQVEAMTMGTRIVVMKDGFVQQIDTPQNLYKYPANKFVAGFIGPPQMNFFDATIIKQGDQVTFCLDCGTDMTVSYDQVNKIQTKYMDGAYPATLGVRPDDVHMDSADLPASEWIKTEAIVSMVEALGGETLVYANLNVNEIDQKLGAIIVKADPDCAVRRGDIINIAINKRKLHVFSQESGESIKPRLPLLNVVNCELTADRLCFAGQSFPLCGVLAGHASAGAELEIPSDALLLGSGNGKAVVANVETIDHKTLYELDVQGHVLFAVEQGEARYAVGDSLSFDLNGLKLSVPACGIYALDLCNALPGEFVKEKADKKTYNFFLQIEGQRIHAADLLSRKLFAIKDTKIFSTPLEYDFDASAVTLTLGHCEDRTAFNGVVTEILDYGIHRYAKVALGQYSLIAPYAGNVGDEVAVAIDSTGISVKDRELDIIIV